MKIVPFEIAKKLKEKGFPQKYMGGYDMIGPTYIDDGRFYENGCITEVARAYSAPTISQVLKWLREKKKIHLIVEISDSGWYYTYYSNIRWKGDRLKSDKYFTSFKTNSSYELAAIAGVEYVIDNLI